MLDLSINFENYTSIHDIIGDLLKYLHQYLKSISGAGRTKYIVNTSKFLGICWNLKMSLLVIYSSGDQRNVILENALYIKNAGGSSRWTMDSGACGMKQW